MSADGSITLDWGDNTHRFRLRIGELLELQEKCNAGPAEIMNRLRDDKWRVEDLVQTMRLGLIGGGMEPLAALVLVRRYVENRPLMESRLPALSVLMAAVIGLPDDPVGKPKAEATTTETAQADLSPPPSSPTAEQSGSPRRKSRRVRSTNSPQQSTAGTPPIAPSP